MEKKNNKRPPIVGIGLVFGVAIGGGVGILLNNIAIGAGVGAGLGIVFGAIIESYMAKKEEENL